MEITLAADALRDTVAEFAAALNVALSKPFVSRAVLDDTAGPGLGIKVSQLINASVIAGTGGAADTLRLITTNFAEAAGYDALGVAAAGLYIAQDVAFANQEIGVAKSRKRPFELGFLRPFEILGQQVDHIHDRIKDGFQQDFIQLRGIQPDVFKRQL